MLLHSQWGDLARPLMMVCHAPSGCPLPGLPKPARIVLALLGGQNQTPEQHLGILSGIARRLRGGRTWELLSAPNATAICALLKRSGG